MPIAYTGWPHKSSLYLYKIYKYVTSISGEDMNNSLQINFWPILYDTIAFSMFKLH